MSEHDTGPTPDQAWEAALGTLAQRIRTVVREVLGHVGAGHRGRDSVTKTVGHGAGDVTFAIDAVAEEAIDGWLTETAHLGPVSIFTEDTGWRHRLADGQLLASEGDAAFDHGGPRVALDPIDGTRNIMHDLRSAWVVVSMAAAGARMPSFGDLTFGLLVEIPDTRARIGRELKAQRGAGSAWLREVDLAGGPHPDWATLHADASGRIDGGYFPFFGFHPACRADVQALAFDVFQRLEREHPQIDLALAFDDQYISSGGQLALLTLGTYRSIVDARGMIGSSTGRETQTAKSYDLAGAVLIAQEAGCIVTAPGGSPLSFPMDATTPVDFAGFHNAATAAQIAPHLRACVGALGRQDPDDGTLDTSKR